MALRESFMQALYHNKNGDVKIYFCFQVTATANVTRAMRRITIKISTASIYGSLFVTIRSA